MKHFTVKVMIPHYVEKEIYIYDATSKTDARRKAKAWGKGEYDMCDTGGDVDYGQVPSKLKVISVEEE